MGKNLKLPRAKDPARAYAWLGSAWNGIADLIERYTNIEFVGANVTITPSGMRVAYPRGAAGSGIGTPVKATGALFTGGEWYHGYVGTGAANYNSGANFTGSMMAGSFTSGHPCSIFNTGAPPGSTNHMWPVSTSNVYTMAVATGATDPNNSNAPVYEVCYTSDLYRVTLTQTGGSASTGYTYTVTNENGENLLTAAAPTFRPLQPSVVNILTAATEGKVAWVSGAWSLRECNEVFNFTACT